MGSSAVPLPSLRGDVIMAVEERPCIALHRLVSRGDVGREGRGYIGGAGRTIGSRVGHPCRHPGRPRGDGRDGRAADRADRGARRAVVSLHVGAAPRGHRRVRSAVRRRGGAAGAHPGRLPAGGAGRHRRARLRASLKAPTTRSAPPTWLPSSPSLEASGSLVGPPVFNTGEGRRCRPWRVRFPSASARSPHGSHRRGPSLDRQTTSCPTAS
jgi:hypothetical protein